MNASYKRYWEPTTTQALTSSIAVGLLATAITQPLDMVKTRIQMRSEGIGIRQIGHYAGYNPNKVFREIHEQGHGMRGLYAGIEAALIGRGVYLFTRNLIYKVIYDRVKPRKPFNDLTKLQKSVLAGIAGACGAIASNPFEVILVRQQTEGALSAGRKRGYTTLMDSYAKVASEGAFLKGVIPHILKAVALNISFSGPYNYINECMWTSFGDLDANRPVAMLFGAFSATAVTLPFDNLKFRYQYAFPDASQNRMNYGKILETIKQVFIVEGWQGFYAGFYAFYGKAWIYGLTTIYLMDSVTGRWKRQSGLKPEYW